jgi:hypothetical protein
MPCNALEQSVKTLAKKQHVMVVQESDPLFHLALFAHAAGVDYTDVDRLHTKDKLKAGRLVRDFFYTDLEDGSDQSTSE